MFGTKLKEAREQAGLTQRELATGLGVSHTYIGEVERGRIGWLNPSQWKHVEILLGLQPETCLKWASQALKEKASAGEITKQL